MGWGRVMAGSVSRPMNALDRLTCSVYDLSGWAGSHRAMKRMTGWSAGMKICFSGGRPTSTAVLPRVSQSHTQFSSPGTCVVNSMVISFIEVTKCVPYVGATRNYRGSTVTLCPLEGTHTIPL
jgi:hypothetical protein